MRPRFAHLLSNDTFMLVYSYRQPMTTTAKKAGLPAGEVALDFATVGRYFRSSDLDVMRLICNLTFSTRASGSRVVVVAV